MRIIRSTDPVTVANYSISKKLYGKTGWRWIKDYLPDGRTVNLLRRILKVNRKRLNGGTKYMFGIPIPRNTRQAYEFNKNNGNTAWTDAIAEEMEKISSFGTFEATPIRARLPQGYQHVPLHMCFAVKWDRRHKARLVAGGNWTEPDRTDVYSGVVTTEAVRIGLLVAAANDLEVRVGDVGNAYLHSQTREKIDTYTGPEFGPLQGRCLIILKALYGLRTSGARWHETFANDLMRLGFTPMRADPNMWIRLHRSGYEYITVYVDNVLVFSKRADVVMEKLQEIYKMKGVGRPELYLGGNMAYFPGSAVMYTSAEKYLTVLLKRLEENLGIRLKNYSSLMEAEYHPELEASPVLGEHDHSIYRMLVGSAQWAVTLGRADIAFAVSTMARFSAMPREGHLSAMFRLYGYLKGSLKAKIIYDTRVPDYSALLGCQEPDWMEMYPGACEEIDSEKDPQPRGAEVVVSAYVNADHA